jgi:membrane associated rhomboid family serine protease
MVRRTPWVTIAVIALCSGLFISTFFSLRKWEPRFQRDAIALRNYYFKHPYLKLSPEMEQVLLGSELVKEFLQSPEKGDQNKHSKWGNPGAVQGGGGSSSLEQEELNRLEQKLIKTIKKGPFKKWGYTPSEFSLILLITYMFLHGSFAHLIGNMYILYLTGPFIEDIWGRPVFTAFYLLSGMVSALLYGFNYPNSVIPLFGASGAIAGVMGAFLIRYWNTRILFFNSLFFFIKKWRTFTAPAWLMLPLWLLLQFLGAKLMDVLKMYGGGPVAYWAHVWGFVFGAAAVVGLKYFRIEEKFSKKLREKDTYVDHNFRVYEEAMEYVGRGERGQAYNMILEALREAPTYPELVESLWKFGFEFRKEREAAGYMVKLIEKEVRDGRMESALSHYRELGEGIPDGSFDVDRHSRVMFADYLLDIDKAEEAEILVRRLLGQVDADLSPADVLHFVNVALRLDLRRDLVLAGKAIELALLHPGIPEEKKEELKAKLYKVPAGAASLSDENIPVKKEASDEEDIQVDGLRPGAQEMEMMGPLIAAGGDPALPALNALMDSVTLTGDMIPQEEENDGIEEKLDEKEIDEELIEEEILELEEMDELEADSEPMLLREEVSRLKPTFAVPVGLTEDSLILDPGKEGQQNLKLADVHSVSVAKILPEKGRSYFLIDLFLDDPVGELSDIRLYRLSGTAFDPGRLVPWAQGSMEAFRIFLSILLKVSNAKPYPDVDSVRLQTVREFPTVKSYEASFSRAADGSVLI